MGSDTLVCKKCNGTKWFQYDHNHMQVCNACCKHEKGYWFLTKHYESAGNWCCLAGCGHILSPKEYKKLNEDTKY